jgi:hypothetical protein
MVQENVDDDNLTHHDSLFDDNNFLLQKPTESRAKRYETRPSQTIFPYPPYRFLTKNCKKSPYGRPRSGSAKQTTEDEPCKSSSATLSD